MTDRPLYHWHVDRHMFVSGPCRLDHPDRDDIFYLVPERLLPALNAALSMEATDD